MSGARHHSATIPPEAAMYLAGNSIPEVSKETGIAMSTLRFRFLKLGILRSRADGVRIAAQKGMFGQGKGKARTFTDQWCQNIKKGRMAWGAENAVGVSVKPNGYVEYTRGPNKGRSVHVVAMEARLGRHIKEDECVHHIDGVRSNNDENNLALVTRSGHARLHRREEKLAQNKEGN